jgi:hypothetical protein
MENAEPVSLRESDGWSRWARFEWVGTKKILPPGDRQKALEKWRIERQTFPR